jgi:hypothetical protein
VKTGTPRAAAGAAAAGDSGEAPGGPGETLPGVPPPPPRVEGIAPVGTFNIEWFGKDGPRRGAVTPTSRRSPRSSGDGAPLLGLQEIG